MIGIYANSNEEAMYPVLSTDADGKPLSGESKHTHLPGRWSAAGQRIFWSVTMYKLPESLLVDNPIPDRYVINSPMLPNLTTNADGSLTLFIRQPAESDKKPNWLPAPQDPSPSSCGCTGRRTGLNGTWQRRAGEGQLSYGYSSAVP